MARATLVVEADLNEDNTYEVDVTSDVISAEIFHGRNDELDSADAGRLSLELNNSQGEYTPALSAWGVGVRVRVRATSPSAVPLFTGWITQIATNPSPRRQSVEITASDRMEILQKTLISTGLMRDQRTGVMIHRILDAAEGELITNGTFQQDSDSNGIPDFCTAVSGATLTRITSDLVLEDPAALQVNTPASGGVAYSGAGAFTVSWPDNVRLLARAYVKPADTASVGKGVTIVLTHDGTDYGTVSNAVLVEGEWSIAEVQAPVITATTDGIKVLDATGATNNFIIGAIHLTYYTSAYPRNIDRGDSFLPYYGPFQRSAAECLEEIRDNELGGLFYLDTGGTARYEQRTRRFLTNYATATIDDTMSEMDFSEDVADRFSSVELAYQNFQQGRPGTVVWAAEMAQSRLLPGTTAHSGTTTIYAPYGFVVKDAIVPVGTTDWLANSEPDGTGLDRTNSLVTLAARSYGEGMQINVVNSSSRDIWLTKLAVRGTPVRQSSDNPLAIITPGTVYNLIENPSVEANLTGVQGTTPSGTVSPTITRTTTSKYGTAAISGVGTGTGLQAMAWTKYDGNRIAVTAGSMYTISVAMRLVNLTGTAGAVGHIGMYWYNNSGSLLTSGSHSFGSGTVSAIPSVTLTQGDGWNKFFYHARAPSSTTAALNAVTALPNFEETVSWGTAQQILFDGAMFNLGGLEDYIDGEQPGCTWVGTAHQSQSYRTNRLNNPLEHSYDWNDNEDSVRQWGRWLADRYSHPKERMNVSLRPRNSTQLDQMINRKVSDRVQLINESKAYATKIRGDYYIESVRHRIRGGGFLHDTNWAVSPVGAEYAMPFWILQDSTFGVLDTTTRAAP